MTAPVVVPAPELSAKFTPGPNTFPWLGADVARSLPLLDAAGRVLWIFADTYWADGDTLPNSRSGSFLSNDSLAVQHGPDLATANVTFHQAPTPSKNWFPISATHHAWPVDGVVIGNDVYITSVRVETGNELGSAQGWALHKVTNGKTLPVPSWASSMLYQSGATGTRPLFSPYVQGGYVYAFASKEGVGWLWARWTLENFTGNGTQGNVEFYTGAGWSTSEASAMTISSSTVTTEGSFHKRPIDGRWMVTDSVGDFPLLGGSIRLAQDKDPSGNYVVAGIGGYKSPPPAFLPKDRVKKDGVYDADIISVNGTSATIKFTSFWGGATETTALSNLTHVWRQTYTNPRFEETPLPPSYWTYAYKAHPALPGEGLVVTFTDNGVFAPPLDIYWPKFYRVLPPTISDFSVSDSGLASWTLGGGPDRVRVRLDGGAWQEANPASSTYQIANYRQGQVVEVQAIGIGGATSRIDEPPPPPPSAPPPLPSAPRVVDWLVHPRNMDLTRTFDPLSGWKKLHLFERYNIPDTWTIEGPASVLGVFSPGMGCIVDRDGEQVTSGQVVRILRRGALRNRTVVETMAVTFASDLALLNGRVVRPSPGTQLTTGAIGTFPAAYDLRSGNVEDLILGYISSNIGPLAIASRRVPRLRLPVSQGRGGTTQVSGRLDNLGALVQSLADAGGLRVRIVHTEDSSGPWLDLVIED